MSAGQNPEQDQLKAVFKKPKVNTSLHPGSVYRLTISLTSAWVEGFEESKTELSLDACHRELPGSNKVGVVLGCRKMREKMMSGSVKKQKIKHERKIQVLVTAWSPGPVAAEHLHPKSVLMYLS